MELRKVLLADQNVYCADCCVICLLYLLWSQPSLPYNRGTRVSSPDLLSFRRRYQAGPSLLISSYSVLSLDL